MPDISLEERIRLLETSMEIQEQILVAIQAERIEAERLADSVIRLGDGATSLGEALRQVDQTQQSLSRLGLEIRDIDSKTANKDDVEASNRQQQEQIERARRRMLAIGVCLVVAVVIGSFVLLHIRGESQREAYANCQRNARTVIAVNSFLMTVAANSDVPEIKSSAQNLVGIFRPPECERP